MAEAIVVVDTSGFENIDNQAVNSINGQINRAQNNDIPLFYVLPEGADLHEDVDEATGVFSILRYSDDADFYSEARIDEQLTGRDIDEVTVIGGGKVDAIAEEESKRGRSVSKGGNGNGNGKAKGQS